MDGNQVDLYPWSKFINSNLSFNVSSLIPFQITKASNQNNLKYDTRVTNWIQSQISTRVILLGAPGSGKTTFIKLVTDQSKFPTENLATDGIAIQNVDNLTFWDFGGQEVLFSTHKFFLVDRCQYVLVVDLSKLIHDDKKIRNECLKYVDFWMKEIHVFTLNHKNSPPILFLGTHCDVLDNLFSNSKIKKGTEALLQLAKVNHLNCVPKVFKFFKSTWTTTLKNNISDIVHQIQINSEKFIKKDIGLTNNDNILHSLKFCILRYNIEAQRQNKPFMLRNEFENLFFGSQNNRESQETIDRYTKLLKVCGIIETYRFESSAASELIFLDPKWLSDIFTSIVSIQMHSSTNRRGFFTQAQIEKNLGQHKIPQYIWNEVIKIFEMFHLVVLLPSGEYYVPAMLHTPKLASAKPSHPIKQKHQLISNAFEEKQMKYNCIRRKYKFSPKIPFGFIDKLIVKYLHFPGIIMHESTSKNDFYLYSKNDGYDNHRFYHILIQVNSKENHDCIVGTELTISIFHPDYEEDSNNNNNNDLYFSFFCHFIFQSPHEIASLTIHSTSSIENIFILGENVRDNPIGEEKYILLNLKQNLSFSKYFISSDIKIFDSDIHNCKIKKLLGSGGFGKVYLGKMKFDASKNIISHVVFKEPRSMSFESLRNLINECMMMKIIENQFTIKLLGICMPSMRFLESRQKMYLSQENHRFSSSSVLLSSEEEYLAHQMLMVIEEAPWGDLTRCHDVLQEKNSTKLKIKIAFDIARGLNSLYFKSGVKLIHRDVKAENVFIFSVDEKSVSSYETVHAKLGDFGSIVVASPSYSQRIGNYQYTAPEALQGSFLVPYSKEIDVYSFGILFWEILTGKIPFAELKENIETCDNIEKMIIKGYRPSLDILPDDTPSCIIDLIKDCWSSKPLCRPSLGKIISILTIILQQDDIFSNEQDIQKYLPSIEFSLGMRQKIIGKNIDSSFFSNIQFKGRGSSNGSNMTCKFTLDATTIYNVTLKMFLYFEIVPEYTRNIFEFLQKQQHPNIVCFIGSFQSVPSDEMMQYIDKSIRDLCIDASGSKKKCQFYIIEEYEKTLLSIIGNLNDNQILQFSQQLSSALLCLFNHNIVHLDIKLDNLMISRTGDLVVNDFGFAGKMDYHGFVQFSQTKGGNNFHLSPEVLSAKTKKINLPCKDQYSWELGMIMFQMFSKGKLPFENYTHSFSFSESCLNITDIPQKFRSLISSLLCPTDKRISIAEAHQILLKINSENKLTSEQGFASRAAGWRPIKPRSGTLTKIQI